jgi:hypothetical protein
VVRLLASSTVADHFFWQPTRAAKKAATVP